MYLTWKNQPHVWHKGLFLPCMCTLPLHIYCNHLNQAITDIHNGFGRGGIFGFQVSVQQMFGAPGISNFVCDKYTNQQRPQLSSHDSHGRRQWRTFKQHLAKLVLQWSILQETIILHISYSCEDGWGILYLITGKSEKKWTDSDWLIQWTDHFFVNVNVIVSPNQAIPDRYKKFCMWQMHQSPQLSSHDSHGCRQWGTFTQHLVKLVLQWSILQETIVLHIS